MSEKHKSTWTPAARPAGRRRGAILLVAIVCVVLCSAFCVWLARLAVLQKRQTDLASWRLQADWLARSALGQAEARLAVDEDYPGQTWHVAREELSGPDAATVSIRVDPVAGEENARRVRIVADYPDDPHFRARRTLETRISR